MQWLRLAVVLGAVAYGEEDCLDRPVRLWITQDSTSSFEFVSVNAEEYVEGLLTELHERIADFDFGFSLFWDRGEDLCYEQISELDGKDFETKVGVAVQALKDAPSTVNGNDMAEDSLSALPMVAKHQFASAPEDAVKIFLIVTDDWAKYHEQMYQGEACSDGRCFPQFETVPGSMNTNPYDEVNCSRDIWYLTVDQITEPLATYNIIPITLVVEKNVDWWQDMWGRVAGLDASQGEFGVFPFTMSVGGVAEAIVDSINTVSCIIKTTSTKTPTTGTGTTTTTGTITTGTGTTGTGTTATTGTGTTGTGTTSTVAPIITTTGVPGTEPDHNKAIAIGSAAAGAAALLAGAAWYKLRDSSPPELDVIEEEGGADAAQAGERESIVAMEEEAYE
ncbi:hypothetical protein GNI_029090 [Gregarina niphandrodes]|uniref:Transmembrane protein n=1 Tax=Gregarina niphandrodes TaxID=110365 RepID=A0A023BBB4_GRENI|nr:hypothetical protein GNI_029090 [Gregarina niphandrodes]EZG79153.1 hypothetical protein GNI_029090 [Gregarina niphandrodes]|eukprot:XP_011129124.1 hypothetical protein GNI_029090 [Gregarina niphandrodes]